MATILFKRGTAKALSEFTNDPGNNGYYPEALKDGYYPAEGEPVFETTTGRFKIGMLDQNGLRINWNDLPYQNETSLESYPSRTDFPKINRRILYKDESTGTLYQGLGGTTYVAISSGGTIDINSINKIIKVICGGDANGTGNSENPDIT